MTMLTARELEFLASLRTRWRELYLIEITRLLKQDDTQARTVNQAGNVVPLKVALEMTKVS